MKYTQDKLIDMLFENQKTISDQVERNIQAFEGVKSSLDKINDQNILHVSKDDARAEVVKKLVDGNEKFYKTVTYLLLILVAAMIVLAGAEKALKFVPFLQ